MGILILAPVIAVLAVVLFLGSRWTRPRPVPQDLRRADEAHAAEAPAAADVLERINSQTIISGPKP